MDLANYPRLRYIALMSDLLEVGNVSTSITMTCISMTRHFLVLQLEIPSFARKRVHIISHRTNLTKEDLVVHEVGRAEKDQERELGEKLLGHSMDLNFDLSIILLVA